MLQTNARYKKGCTFKVKLHLVGYNDNMEKKIHIQVTTHAFFGHVTSTILAMLQLKHID